MIEVIETGIKAVDLIAPLVAEGTLAISGPAGTGQAVLAIEIVNNLVATQQCSAVFSVPDQELFRTGLREAEVEAFVEGGPPPGRVRISRRGSALAAIVLGPDEAATSWIVMSRELLKGGQLPAIDLARSGTHAALAPAHKLLAERARAAAADGKAGMLLAFLRQWFKVGEPWTGQPAEYSSLAATLAGAERLLPSSGSGPG